MKVAFVSSELICFKIIVPQCVFSGSWTLLRKDKNRTTWAACMTGYFYQHESYVAVALAGGSLSYYLYSTAFTD